MEKKFKYRITRYGKPELVEIERETKSSIWVKGGRGYSRKDSQYEQFFNTIDEAKKWIISLAKVEVDKYESSLRYYMDRLKETIKETETWE